MGNPVITKIYGDSMVYHLPEGVEGLNNPLNGYESLQTAPQTFLPSSELICHKFLAPDTCLNLSQTFITFQK